MDRVRDIIPVPHVTSHSLQTPHSLTVQSITAGGKKKEEKSVTIKIYDHFDNNNNKQTNDSLEFKTLK